MPARGGTDQIRTTEVVKGPCEFARRARSRQDVDSILRPGGPCLIHRARESSHRPTDPLSGMAVTSTVDDHAVMPALTSLVTPLGGLVLPVATALVISAPVPPVIPMRVVAPFEAPESRYGAGHRGIDVAADTDQPVASITAGRIGFAGTIAGKAVVTVLMTDGRRVTYEPVTSELTTGTPVRAGQLIGTVAPRGGHCGGSLQPSASGEPHRSGCLHIGLLRGDDYLDPMALLRRPAVLKPLRP